MDIPLVNLSDTDPKPTRLQLFPKTNKTCFWNALSRCESTGEQFWIMMVTGKGDKERSAAVAHKAKPTIHGDHIYISHSKNANPARFNLKCILLLSGTQYSSSVREMSFESFFFCGCCEIVVQNYAGAGDRFVNIFSLLKTFWMGFLFLDHMSKSVFISNKEWA